MRWFTLLFCISILFTGSSIPKKKPYIPTKENFAYKNLEKALSKFLEVYDTCETVIKIPSYKDSLVFKPWLKQYLVEKKLLNPHDSIIDSLITVSIKKFQEFHGLNPDGIVGAKTAAALKIPGKVLYQKIIVNQERWKALNIKDPTYIFINIPAFNLSIINKEKTDLKFKTIVGKPDWKTPVISSKVNEVIIYPYWYVPRSIAIKESIPEIKKDINYLHKNNFTVINSKNQILDPETIDWKNLDFGKSGYILRQNSGKENALGVVKFNFPSPYSIYMHDTPAKQLFEKENRALSHGCIRLEKPLELINYLHQNEFLQISLDSIQNLIENKVHIRILLKNPIPIYVGYFTCEADADGNIYFYNDVYRKDEGLERMLFY